MKTIYDFFTPEELENPELFTQKVKGKWVVFSPTDEPALSATAPITVASLLVADKDHPTPSAWFLVSILPHAHDSYYDMYQIEFTMDAEGCFITAKDEIKAGIEINGTFSLV
jgi:hypothetical protein